MSRSLHRVRRDLRFRKAPPTLVYPDVVEQLARDGITTRMPPTRGGGAQDSERKGMVIDAADRTRAASARFS